MDDKFTIEVNGQVHNVQEELATPLLYVLRDQLELNSPKYGCGLGQCGSCMVLLDGKATPSCLISVGAVKGQSITTLEGLIQKDGTLHPVQQAFVQEQAAQCGYCLNGMIMSAVALLQENRQPDDASIRSRLQSNLCRCGTQTRIIRAIKKASANSNP